MVGETFEAAKTAVRALRANLFRTVLTLLGIVIGVASVIAMLAIGDGAKQLVLDRISAMGTNLLLIRPGQPNRRGVGGTVASLVPEDAEVINKYLRMIQQEAFRCKEITQKLLDFSRTGGSRERTDLGQLITDVVEMARHLQNARGKSIRFAPERTVFAPVNGRDVKSVVLNLVVNALDCMDDGGSLTIGLASREGFAELTFADTGHGMTKDVLENIFEPFFTRKQTGNGTGLGLSISHQIIHQHNGSIAASSAGAGKGSTFIVRLPVAESNVADDADRPAVIPFPASRVAA